jgi:hypothetical protein
MKQVIHIDKVKDRIVKTNTGRDLIIKERNLFNSCRYCNEGRGIYKVIIEELNEIYYLCEKHYKEEPLDNILEQRIKGM